MVAGEEGLRKKSCEKGDLNPHGCYPTSPSRELGTSFAILWRKLRQEFSGEFGPDVCSLRVSFGWNGSRSGSRAGVAGAVSRAAQGLRLPFERLVALGHESGDVVAFPAATLGGVLADHFLLSRSWRSPGRRLNES